MSLNLPVVLTGAPIATSSATPDATWIRMPCPPHAASSDDGTGIVAVADAAMEITWSEDLSTAQDGTTLAELAGGVVDYIANIESAPVVSPRGGGIIWGKVTANAGGATVVRATFRQPQPGAVTVTGGTVAVTGAINGPAGASPADAESNTQTTLSRIGSRLFGFNGTTWDRLRTALTTPSATLTGILNVLGWAVYHASPTARTEGQGGPLEAMTDGSLRTTEQTVPGYSSHRSQNISSATNIKSGAGVFHTLALGAGVANATLTYTDDTGAGGGAVLYKYTCPATLSMPDCIVLDIKFTTGLTVTPSSASLDATESYA